jgi:hypothetical protein
MAIRWSFVALAPITIRCDCGEARSVPYGERWACESCGRRWNTSQIPSEEYWRVVRDVRRYRNLIIGVALLFAAIILPFAVFVSQRFFVLLLLVLGSWAFYARPFLRRRARRKLSERPTWTLRPE